MLVILVHKDTLHYILSKLTIHFAVLTCTCIVCLRVRIRVAVTGLQESTGGAWGGPPRQRSDWNDTKLDDDGEEDSWEKQAEELYPADDESGPDPGPCFHARHVKPHLDGL